jgi:nickel-dependent lactate racemase
VKPGEKIAIVTSDITRPVPGEKIIPAILEQLWRTGANPEDVTVVFALGSHRRHTAAEMERLVGRGIYNAVMCVDSDPLDCVKMGVTALGTPVDITRIVAEADRRICVGNIEYHYFAGYSGGAKAIMPGVSTREAIQANHRHMLHPKAKAGILEGNPVREDIEEAALFCPVDFIVNVVLDEHKEIICAVAGHHIRAHREACAYLDRIYQKKIGAPADIVVASQGGAPKDINLYQTQKALDNACRAVRQGGIVILVGECGEGMGEEVFERWFAEAKTPGSLIERIKSNFVLGGHKAAAIAIALETADIYLVSKLPDELVNSIFLRPFATAQAALDAAFGALGHDSSVLVMPFGGSTLPKIVPTVEMGMNERKQGSK